MKTVYLVRHGETVANLAQVWQDESDVLSPQGFLQAENLALRLQSENFDKAYCSSYVRAKQTADILQLKLGIEFESSDLFKEVQGPTSTVGIKYEKVEGNRINEYLSSRDSAPDISNFRFEDEETLFEVVTRARSALARLETVEAKKILVITHGTFMRTLVSLVLNQHEPDRTAAGIFHAGRYLETTNTGITVINKAAQDNSPWSLLTFNDHNHFVE